MDVSLARVVPPDARRARGHGAGPRDADHSYFAYVTVEGIDQFYDEVLGNGASLMQGLADKPWGMRDFGVRTRTGTGLCSARNSEPPAAEQRYELDLQHAACHQI